MRLPSACRWLVMGTVFVTGCAAFTCGAGEPDAAAAAQAYGRANPVVAPEPDGTIVCEAEEFQVQRRGWQAKNWGTNYYAATFANTFLSRKAYLGAPEQCEETVATREAQVPTAGRYLALVRYEAAYRFETQFTLRIEQEGKVLLDRLYGARDNMKVWALGQRLKTEIAWGWGAVENVVWEGHDTYVDLQPGKVKLTLIAGRQQGDAARRNVDLVLLTTDEEQVTRRIKTEQYLPLDGMLTQSGDLYMKLHNQADGSKMTLKVGAGQEHSPYWIHMRNWSPKALSTEPGQSTDWVEVGSVLDALNDGQWSLVAQAAEADGALHYKLELGLMSADGSIEPIRTFESRSGKLELAYDANTRYTRRIRLTDDVLYDLLDYLKAHPVRGKRPERTLVFCYTFGERPDDPRYTAALREFVNMMSLAGPPEEGSGIGNLGDEIGLSRPPGDDHAGFRMWLQGRGLKPSDVDPAAGESWDNVAYSPTDGAAKTKPELYYYSRRYLHHYGIQVQKVKTDAALREQPGAMVGANYSPHGNRYLGEVHKWVTLFREGGMTMPWSEDYIWQLPMGTQQMNFINLDLFRAGLKGKPDAMIHYYVMPHAPGNTPRSWRRQFYGDVAHGMKIINLFEFRPVYVAYTENHVDLPEMYLEVRRAFYEMGLFEDIMQDGRVEPGVAALWFSETGDIWHDRRPPFDTGKRALYIAILHQQLPLDFVIEEDALAGDLKDYRVLYLADAHVSRAASRAIADWVAGGGRLFATAGAGMFDEFNRPNEILRGLLGVEQTALEEQDKMKFIKEDMPFTAPMDTVTWQTLAGEVRTPVIAARSRIELRGADVRGTFSDGSPAITVKRTGGGLAFYCAFLPGLSYFKPAMPLRPMDRGATDDAMSHFIPTEFDAGVAALIGGPVAGVERPVLCSEPLVEAKIIRAEQGVLIPLVNWSAGPVEGLTVTVGVAVPTKEVTLASGRPVRVATEGGKQVFTLDLDVADALILR